MSTIVCPSGKRRYRRRRFARKALLRMQGSGKACTLRAVYQCQLCGGYHLTSQSRKEREQWRRRTTPTTEDE